MTRIQKVQLFLGTKMPLLQNLFQPIVCTVRSSMRWSVSFACIIYDSMGKESCYLKKCFVPLMGNTSYRVFGQLRHPIDLHLIFESVIDRVISLWSDTFRNPFCSKGLMKLAILADYKHPKVLFWDLPPHRKVQKLDFQSEFSMSNIIKIFLVFFC